METSVTYDDLTLFTDSWWNTTTALPTSTAAGAVVPPAAGRALGGVGSHALKAVYVAGVAFNALAMVALRHGERRVRNRKHLLLLTALAANDLVALAGMLCAMVAAERAPWLRGTRPYCAARVALRVFGVGSVCIAVTMALERYLALTRPFLYQKQVTYVVIRTALVVSWGWAALLTCAPVLGLGLYYSPEAEQRSDCPRYRNAVTTPDIAYAGFYVFFGTLLCVVLVYCNLAVIRALYEISAPRAGDAPVLRRLSRNSCRQRTPRAAPAPAPAPAPPVYNAATAEEVAFSRLMATLSVLFMICWLPQMVTSALYLWRGPAGWPALERLSRAADVLMLLNYVLDPLLYVLLRRRRPALALVCHPLRCCRRQGHKTSTESMTKTCCPQETLLVSENSSGIAEMRCLAPQPAPQPAPSALAPDATDRRLL